MSRRDKGGGEVKWVIEDHVGVDAVWVEEGEGAG